MKINSGGQMNKSSQLKGKMKVSNNMAGIKDGFTPSGDKSAIGDFFHDIGDKIKYMFMKDGVPEKDGGYVPSADGKGFVWCEHPDSEKYNPEPYTSKEGCWSLKQEACSPDVWYWRPYTDPENEHGPYGVGSYLMWSEDGHIISGKDPKPEDFSTGGKWHLDTACGACNWWWAS